jgi:branched-chain amino acid transport system ATP-binding protein
MSEPVLVVDDVTAGYNRLAAIRGISLTARAGEVVTLLGPNGAGKSTTLLTIAGQITPMSGSVSAFGAPINSRRPHVMARRGLHLVPDDRGLFSSLTVAEHIRLAQRRPDKKRERGVLEGFPVLGSLRDRKVGLLSGGEQQMLAIAMAFLAESKLMMIDEMSLGLAPKIVQQILPTLRGAVDEEGILLLLVEQHVELALQVSDRAIVLNHGSIVLEGSAAELLADRSRLEAAYFDSVDQTAGSVGE